MLDLRRPSRAASGGAQGTVCLCCRERVRRVDAAARRRRAACAAAAGGAVPLGGPGMLMQNCPRCLPCPGIDQISLLISLNTNLTLVLTLTLTLG